MQIPETEIIVTKDGAEFLRKTVRPGEYIIGREPTCDVQVEVELISRRHAQLTVNFDHAMIEDLGSSNGTFVNGQPIKEPTRLWPNQKIQLGAATIELRRIKTIPPPDVSLAPQTATVERLLPEEFLREKKYEIGKIVAQGGMGAILDAREVTIERRVAMKVMLDGSNPDDLTRFVTEAKITGQLEHPSIVPVYELSVDENGQVFYTMKMVRGITLKKVLELLADGFSETEKKYPLPVLLTIFQKVCDAIAFAHAKGVIHRDLKPENIMLDDFGVVLVMDWGLAKVLGGTRSGASPTSGIVAEDQGRAGARPFEASATLAGTVMGTPQYMSPEQARGEVEDLDVRSDIYALGAILYHILALRPPVTGKDPWAMVAKASQGAVEPLTAPTNRTIPDSIAAVVRKAISFEREKRYPLVADLQRDIEAYQNGRATMAENAGLGRHFFLALKRHKTIATAVALVLLSGGGFGVNTILEGRRAEREAKRANHALAELKKTAPALRQLAASEAEFQHFESALQKLDAALALDPGDSGSYWQRGWILIGLEKWSDAIAALQFAAEKDPAKAKLADIVPTLEELAASSEQQRWTSERVARLTEYLELANASGELAALSGKLRLGASDKQKLVQDRIRQWLGPPFASRVEVMGAGLVLVSLNGLNIDTLEPLHGLPIDRLNLAGCHVTTLEPLRGMKLSFLELFGNPVSDLSPLHGMPLRELTISGTKATDFSPLLGAPLQLMTAFGFNLVDISFLNGAPLRYVHMGNNRITDLRSLTGGPLEILEVQGSQITDLSPLRGKPLRVLWINGNRVRDLNPLRGAPIVELKIEGNPIEDYAPLLDLPKLENLSIGGDPKGFILLRRHPTLKSISTGNGTYRPVAEFWAEYDARHPASPK